MIKTFLSALLPYFTFGILAFLAVVPLSVHPQVPSSKLVYKTVISEKPGELVYQFDFPDAVPVLDETGHITSWDFPGADRTLLSGLPLCIYLMELPSAPATVTIVRSTSHILRTSGRLTAQRTQPLARIEYAGQMRDIPIHHLILCPIQTSGNQLVMYGQLVVKITYATSSPVKITENPAEIDGALQVSTLNADFARRQRIFKTKSFTNKNIADAMAAGNETLRLEVDSNGIYKLTYEDMISAGVNPRQVNPQQISLQNLGLEVPIYIRTAVANQFGPGDFIEFYGEKYTADKNPALRDQPQQTRHFLDPWTDNNVYFLSWQGRQGLRLIEENAGIILPGKRDSLSSIHFLRTRHFEEDNSRVSFKDLNTNKPSAIEDIWFFDGGISNLLTTQSQKTYFFTLEGLSSLSSSQVLTINLQGISPTSHTVDIKINDAAVSTSLTWSNIAKFQTQISIPNLSGNILKEGANTITISTPVTSNPNQLQLQALNWFEITYKQKYEAIHNYLEFTVGDLSPTVLKQFKIEKFTDPDISVYKKGVSKLVNFDLRTDQGDRTALTYFIDLQDRVQPGESVQYIAVGESAKLKPKRITLQASSTLKSGFHNARYVIVCPKTFRATADRLRQYRQSTGLSAEVVDLEDIYTEFNFGIKSPYALRNFLRYTYSASNWQGTQGPPLYVVLVGDASIKTKSSPFDLVPTQQIQTKNYGPAASDHWYTLLTDDDLISDFFLGRIPCTNAAQLDAYIDKIITYETSSLNGDWKNRVTFIGGQRDDRGVQQNNPNVPTDVFRFQATNLINNKLPSAFSPDRIYVYPIRDQFYGNFSNVIDRFDNGSLIMAYLGHGGGGIWGDLDSVSGKPLLNLTQVQSLQSGDGRLPLVLSMTCFVGAFDDDSKQSLGESLVLTPNRGSIGLLASSGTGWIIGDYLMLDQSLQPFATPGLTVGQAMAIGKADYLVQQGAVDIEVSGAGNGLGLSEIPQSMAYQFNYLGDPALKLKTPAEGNLELSTYSPTSGGSLTMSGSTPFLSGNGRAELYQLLPVVDSVLNGGNKPSFVNLDTVFFVITNGTFSVNLDLSQVSGLIGGSAGLRIFTESSDGNQSFHASRAFSVDATFLGVPSITPSNPTSADSIHVQITANDPQTIQNVLLYYQVTGNANDSGIESMQSSGSNLYRSRGLGPFPENSLLSYQVKVIDGVGDSTWSQAGQIKIASGIDLGLSGVVTPGTASDGIQLTGDQNVQLSARILNRGFATVASATVQFYDGDPRNTGALVGSTTVAIQGGNLSGEPASATASISSTLSSGAHTIYVWIDPDSALADVNRDDNLGFALIQNNAFNVLPSVGTTFNGISTDTVSIDQSLSAVVPPAAVVSTSALRLVKTSTLTLTGQPDIQLVTPLGQSGPAAYQLSVSSPVSPDHPLRLAMRYDTTSYPLSGGYPDSISIYRWSTGNRRWSMQHQSVVRQNGEIWVSLSGQVSGLYTLFLNRDDIAPIVESTIEGQFFLQGSIAPKQPKIAAIITDRNGVSLNRADYSIQINGESVPDDQINLPDSLANSNTVTLTLKTTQDFATGSNQVTFRATDVNGNASAIDTLSFTVVSKFDIQLLGNFPNPFSNTTVFAYRVESSEPLDNLELSIYTVSGRRIKRIQPEDISSQIINSVGYHEIPWDATDDDGHSIANGIYFYQIKGRLNGKTVQKKGKLAYFR